MFSCRKASRLLSDSLDRELTRREKLALRFHLFICKFCRRAAKQFRFIQEIGARLRQLREDALGRERLTSEAKERILEKLSAEG